MCRTRNRMHRTKTSIRDFKRVRMREEKGRLGTLLCRLDPWTGVRGTPFFMHRMLCRAIWLQWVICPVFDT